MNKIKTINVFTIGDSSLLNTWSNIPYFLTTTLERQGYIINRINIESNHIIQKFWDKIILRVLAKLFRNNIYWYDRTFLCYVETFIKIWRANKKYRDNDINLFITYSFYNPFSKKPNVLFSDWDYETMIKDKRQRDPYFFEKWSIMRQRKVIKKADLIISLFPNAAEEMKLRYNKSNIICLDKNVVNVFFDKEIDEKNIIEKKQNSYKLLFIGTLKYLESAKLLIKVYKDLKNFYPLLELVIIGIEEKQLPKLPGGVVCYGYLNKGNSRDNEIYYKELISAKLFINPTPVWAGYSSTIEAMFFYTPVIVSPYTDFVKEFGRRIDFGMYCEDFNISSLKHCIKQVLDKDNYEQMCVNARNRVKDYTWDSYVKKLMIKIQNI